MESLIIYTSQAHGCMYCYTADFLSPLLDKGRRVAKTIGFKNFELKCPSSVIISFPSPPLYPQPTQKRTAFIEKIYAVPVDNKLASIAG